MKRKLFTSTALFIALLAACSDDAGTLTNGTPGGGSRTPTPTDPGSETPHAGTPSAPGETTQAVDPAQVRAVGSPEVTSRMHGCGKLSVASIGQLLQSRGLDGNGQRPGQAPSGLDIFQNPDTPSALGAANYSGRAGEAPFASTSAVSKMFDIFTMASYDVVAADWAAPACPGVKLMENNAFTRDGISCLIGKPATAEHVAIANDAIAKSPQDGAKIAIAALLAAAHTCQ